MRSRRWLVARNAVAGDAAVTWYTPPGMNADARLWHDHGNHAFACRFSAVMEAGEPGESLMICLNSGGTCDGVLAASGSMADGIGQQRDLAGDAVLAPSTPLSMPPRAVSFCARRIHIFRLKETRMASFKNGARAFCCTSPRCPAPHGIGDFGPGRVTLSTGWRRPVKSLAVTADDADRPRELSVPGRLRVRRQPVEWMSSSRCRERMAGAPGLPDGGFSARQVTTAGCCPGARRNCAPRPMAFLPGEFDGSSSLCGWCASQADWLDGLRAFHERSGSPRQGQPGGTAFIPGSAASRPACRPCASNTRGKSPSSGNSCNGVSTFVARLKTYAKPARRGHHGRLGPSSSRTTARCWARPDLYFLMNISDHGGGPVAACSRGRWGSVGNPLYRWERMAQEDFAWGRACEARAGNSPMFILHRPLPRLCRLL